MFSHNHPKVTLIVRIFFSTILLLVVTGKPVSARKSSNAVTCGDTINSPGDYFLGADCIAPIGFEITITASNVTLHLMGHTIRSPGLVGSFGGFGINAHDVSNVKILGPGTITGGFTYGVVFQNVSNSVIRNVSGNDNGAAIVLLESNTNKIVRNEAHNNGYGIFTIDSDDNEIEGNEANDNFAGIYLEGSNDNKIKRNETNENKDMGILLNRSNNNEIEGNKANDNEDVGIFVTGFGNQITKNSARRNGIDLIDTNLDCDNNRWEDNAFDTSNPSFCID
jgi:parallel beta-helix repeat protein